MACHIPGHRAAHRVTGAINLVSAVDALGKDGMALKMAM
jgi:hypothetical protein